MLRLPHADEWLGTPLVRVKRLASAESDGGNVVMVWPLGTNAANTNGGIRLAGHDADAVLAYVDGGPEAEVVSFDPADGDDLTRIKGVGPKSAVALHAAELGSFASIAEASPDAVRAAIEAADILAVGGDEIRSWISQAAALRLEAQAA